MTATVCLQGGGEFSPACREMDAELVRRAPGRVVVTALAGEPGRDYATATANGVRHFLAVGARDVVAAPDVRDDPAAALEALASASLLVLPGGSPSRLLAALTGTPAGACVLGLLEGGGVVTGSSAGAMVLCSWTVLPDRSSPAGPAVAPGLGALPGLGVVPHWRGTAGREDWVRGLTATGATVLGIPEESGVLVRGRTLTAVGRSATVLVGSGRELAVGESTQVP